MFLQSIILFSLIYYAIGGKVQIDEEKSLEMPSPIDNESDESEYSMNSDNFLIPFLEKKKKRPCVYCNEPIDDAERLTLNDGCECHIRCSHGSRICTAFHPVTLDVDDSYKLQLILLPTQSGKTFVTLAMMKAERKYVNIVCTKDTKVARDQFGNRLRENGLRCYFIGTGLDMDGEGNFLTTDEMLKKIREDYEADADVFMPDCIVMCTTKSHLGITKRMKKNGVMRSDLEKIINCIWKISQKKCCLIFDESQETEKTISEVRKKNMYSNKVVAMYHVTATPRKNLEYGGVFFVFDCFSVKGFDLSTYKGLEDCTFFPRGISKIPRNATDFILNIGMSDIVEKDPRFYEGIYYTLKEHDILRPRNYVFIPGKTSIKSHDVVVDICLAINPETVVVVINHKYKCLQYINEYGELAPQKELNDKLILDDAIVEAVQEEGLTGRPLVVTGLNCVLASQTLTNSILGPFTHAIFGYDIIHFKHLKDGGIYGQDRAYQLGGRTTGKRDDRIVKCKKCFSDNLSVIDGGHLECLDCETEVNYPSELIYTNKKTHKIMIKMKNKNIKTIVFCDRRFKRVALDAEVKTKEMVKRFRGKPASMEDYDKLGEKNPLEKGLKVHILRVIIGSEEINRKDYEDDNIREFRVEHSKDEPEGFAKVIEYAQRFAPSKDKRKIVYRKGKFPGTPFYKASNANRYADGPQSTDEIWKYCPTYDRSLLRGNLYACYRDPTNEHTLEYWYAYGIEKKEDDN
jgi:hypothetical protein